MQETLNEKGVRLVYQNSNSEDRINRAVAVEDENGIEFTFEELLDFHASCDVPSAQVDLDEFLERLKERAPKYDGPGLEVYRGTSLETYEKYGSGYIWSRERDVGNKFAHMCVSLRYKMIFAAIDRRPILLKAYIPATGVIYAHKNERGEDEVFLDPHQIEAERIITMSEI